MDQSYLGSRERKWPIPLFITGIVIIVGGAIFFLGTRKKELVSPVPKEPSFQVIFYTPTPGFVTPTPTPLVTPKGKVTSIPSPKPTRVVTPSPTKKVTPSLTPKPSPSITS